MGKASVKYAQLAITVKHPTKTRCSAILLVTLMKDRFHAQNALWGIDVLTKKENT